MKLSADALYASKLYIFPSITSCTEIKLNSNFIGYRTGLIRNRGTLDSRTRKENNMHFYMHVQASCILTFTIVVF